MIEQTQAMARADSLGAAAPLVHDPYANGRAVVEPVDPFRDLTARPFAIAALLCFAPVVISFGFARGAWWVDYPGILFHLAMFMLVAKLPAPGWAKAAGFGWLFLDVAVGVMTLDGVSRAIGMPMRYGGHIFGGTWIAVASLTGSRWLRIGVLNGLLLFCYTFASPFLPGAVLSATAPLWLVWLALVAWKCGPARTA